MRQPVVRVESGSVRGNIEGGVAIFRGIPFAAPPTGERRFLPPAPAEPWGEVREATAFGADCLTNEPGTTGVAQSEDCLFVNVWTPRLPTGGDGSLPVMVFLHGGAFRSGGSSVPLYDSADLARQGLVAISLNYRLGPLGFLVSLQDGLTGNLGLWDQQAALGWVQRNVGLFGGDPSRVTLFGESAGAMSIAVHLTLRSSESLFARAILQSSPASHYYRPLRLADKLGQAFIKRFDCDSIHCLREEPASAILREWGISNLPRAVTDFIYWAPVYGPGSGVERSPQLWANMQEADSPAPKPILMGSNAHEGAFFIAQAFSFSMPRALYLSSVAFMFGLSAPAVLGHYALLPLEGWRASGDYKQPFAQILTDYMFRCATRNASQRWHKYVHTYSREQRRPIYLYYFTQRSNHTGPEPCRGLACHMSELPFVFNRSERGVASQRPFSSDEVSLTDAVMSYWISFARHGHPNERQVLRGTPSERPYWPAWSPEVPAQLQIEWPLRLAGSYTCDATCGFWDQLGYRF